MLIPVDLVTLADGTGPASDAFEAAKRYFKKTSSLKDQERSLLDTATCIEDVQEIVADSLAVYGTRSETSRTRKWLQKASGVICHYGTVLDVFVQHHPEYVSLVWGTMKILFIVSVSAPSAVIYDPS